MKYKSLNTIKDFMSWFGNNANLLDYIKYIFRRKGIRVGFCSEVSINSIFLKPYFLNHNNLIATTRLRVNDIIYHSLNYRNLNARFYNPFSKYNALIFQSESSPKSYLIASKFKRKGAKIILDLNVNLFLTQQVEFISEKQKEDVLRFLNLTDLIITTTEYLRDFIIDNKIFSNVKIIPEIISDNFFKVKKKHETKETTNLLYVGYSVKAKELELINNQIEALSKNHNIRLTLICEKLPKLNINVKKSFIKYDQVRLPYDMLKGDIFISPRDLKNPYNLGHSFTKIGYPMAVGLPIIVSPIPSYKNSPAILLSDNNESWYNEIESLILNPDLRNKLGEEGIKFCKEKFSKDIIMKKFYKMIGHLLKK
jgi:glycosyltransferase involved in cell wall biosynthesis